MHLKAVQLPLNNTRRGRCGSDPAAVATHVSSQFVYVCCGVKMCKIRTLRTLVNERLSTVVEEVFDLLETTIAEYEKEIERQRRLLEAVARPEGQINTAGEW